MDIYFSPSTLGFYSSRLKAQYEENKKWPDDAVRLTAHERHAYHVASAPAGHKLGADANGRPTWVARPVLSLAYRRAVANRQIDEAAGNARARHVSAGQLVEEEYHLALQQANEWRAAGSPADDVPAAVQDWADAANLTAEAAASDIEQTAAGWQAVLIQIRKIRLAGKTAVDAAEDQGTADDMALIAEPYISQLDELSPA